MAIDRRGPDERPDGDGPESFVGRWSRRKREARAEQVSAEPSPPERSSPEPSQSEPAPAGDAPEPVLTDADMPPLESLDASSDWSGFMSPGVSPELRKAALRRLFHLPEFNVRDGLNDYDEDFTTFEALGDIVTSDMRHQIEREEARARAESEAQATDRARAGDEPGALDSTDPGAGETELGEEAAQASGPAEPAGQEAQSTQAGAAGPGRAPGDQDAPEAPRRAAASGDPPGGGAPGGAPSSKERRG